MHIYSVYLLCIDLKELDEKREFAQKNMGDTEVAEAILNKCHYYAKIGTLFRI